MILLIVVGGLFLTPARASEGGGTPSVRDTDTGVFNRFVVDIEPGISPDAETSSIYREIDSSLSNALVGEAATSYATSIGYVEDPPMPFDDENEIKSVSMSGPVIMQASGLNISIFNFDYATTTSASRVTAIKFETSTEDSRMVAVSAFDEEDDVILSWLLFESTATDIFEGFGDSVSIDGPHTLAESYLYLSETMRYASSEIYNGSTNTYYAALETAYLQMAAYSELIAFELESNVALPSFNKPAQTTIALLADPTFSGSANYYIRFFIKCAIYSVYAAAVYGLWALIGNPGIGVLLTAALVPALYLLGSGVLGMAFNLMSLGLNILANSMPWWLFWAAAVLRFIAWTIDNAAVFLIGWTVFSRLRTIVYGLSRATMLFWVGLWLFIDYITENGLDSAGLFRDY